MYWLNLLCHISKTVTLIVQASFSRTGLLVRLEFFFTIVFMTFFAIDEDTQAQFLEMDSVGKETGILSLYCIFMYSGPQWYEQLC